MSRREEKRREELSVKLKRRKRVVELE